MVVAVAGCGVCHTDLGYYYDGVRTNQPLPLALGHEISGRVVAAGAGAEAWIGQAVIVPAVLPCGECDLCRRGLATICRAQKMPGNDIQGGFATHIVVPARGLCAVDEKRLAAAGLTLAEVSIVADALTTPYQAVRRAGVDAGRPGDRHRRRRRRRLLRAGGARLRRQGGGHRRRRAQARGHGRRRWRRADAERARPRREGAEEGDRRFARQQGLRATEWIIFECSGTAAGQTTAFGLLVHGATLSVVGFTMDKVEVRLSNLMAFDARALGNWGCPPESYPAALDLVLDGKVKLEPFVETHPLADINRVFDAVHRREIKRRAVMVP